MVVKSNVKDRVKSIVYMFTNTAVPLETLRQKDEKHTEGELENDIPENCARSSYEQRCTHHQCLHTF